MAVFKTHISWTNSTWNPTTGCTKVSAGCDHCYAEAITNLHHGGGFENVRTHPDRLKQVEAFGPLDERGGKIPRMVFVDSMSDLMHEKIPDAFRDLVFERMESTPRTIYQVLTKRRGILRRYIEGRYGRQGSQGSAGIPRTPGVPPNIWLGVSVEDGRVANRIDTLRNLKDAVGGFTAFLSVEPLIGPPAAHDYRGIEWVLIGGESGPGAREMLVPWPRLARDKARAAGAAVWMKQFGTWRSNPLYRPESGANHLERVRRAIAAGEKLAWIVEDAKTGKPRIEGEKGGATLDGQVLHELPPAWHALKAELNRSLV